MSICSRWISLFDYKTIFEYLPHTRQALSGDE
jgi:hypothetical protein